MVNETVTSDVLVPELLTGIEKWHEDLKLCGPIALLSLMRAAVCGRHDPYYTELLNCVDAVVDNWRDRGCPKGE